MNHPPHTRIVILLNSAIQQTVIPSVQVWFLSFFFVLILVQQTLISWFSFMPSLFIFRPLSDFVFVSVMQNCNLCRWWLCAVVYLTDFVKRLFLSCVWVEMTQMRLSECLAYEFICSRSCLGWLMLSRSCVSGLFVLDWCCSWVLIAVLEFSLLTDPNTKQLFRFLTSLSQFLMLVFRDF